MIFYRPIIVISLIIGMLILPNLLLAAEYSKTTYKALPGWEKPDAQALSNGFSAFQKSCKQMLKTQKYPVFGAVHAAPQDFKKICTQAVLLEPNGNKTRAFFEQYFEPYEVSEKNNPAAFYTGYFEIEITGSRTKHGAFTYPIYAKPRDLKEGKPYFTRAEINRGALAGRGLEIAFTDDPVRLFFLHVQGSGRVNLTEGGVLHLGFAAKNQQPYVSIGKYLRENGAIKGSEISAEQVMDWLRANPQKMPTVMEQNPSYIFFRESGKVGPLGAASIPLTPEGSLAVDKRYVPLHTPVWVDTKIGIPQNMKSYQRLFTAQDTGSAIVGANRADIFFGFGARAEQLAGHTQSKGTLYVLVPKPQGGSRE